MIQRNDKLFRAIHSEKGQTDETDAASSTAASATHEGKDNNIENDVNKEETDPSAKPVANHNVPPLDQQVKELNQQLQNENKALHHLNTSLHEKNHFLSLKQAEFQELINAEVTKNEELQNKHDDLDYEVTKCRMKITKLETGLIDAQESLKLYVDKDGGEKLEQKVVLSNAEKKSVEQLNQDLEEQRELASTRMIELEKTNENYKQALKEVEKLKMELSTLPEHVVVETTEHKCLQSQFSVLYNEAMQLKTQLEESRNQLQVAKNTHMRQIEQMESEELLAQKKLRTEVIQLEDMLAQVKKEYEMLRIEFEQNLAANEQTGPINKEMRNLITSLQTHNVQLKGEVARYKRKYKDTSIDVTKLKKDVDDLKLANEAAKQQLKKEKQVAEEREEGNAETSGNTATDVQSNNTSNTGTDASGENENGTAKIKSESSADTPSDQATEEGCEDSPDSSVAGGTPIKTEKVATVTGTPTPTQGTPLNTPIKKEAGVVKTENPQELKQKIEELQRQKSRDQDGIKDLKSQLKKALNDVKEMKLLLDMYKTCTKEQRDKAQVMASEKKARADLDEVKAQLKKVTETKRDEKKRLADEDATRRIKQLEDQSSNLQKQVANTKQEEETLLNEMEVTGQAFEDMQEQNSRLILQLREKDDANFKLMSERIKSNQIQRLAREEREKLQEQGITLSTQIEAQNQVVRKLEEKERLLQSNLVAMDKVRISNYDIMTSYLVKSLFNQFSNYFTFFNLQELSMRQQAMEMHKRKAIESAQSAADLKLHLEKYHAQIKEVQQTVAEKTSALEAEAFKTKRLHEQLESVKRKVERLRKIEMASDTDMDQILKEEIREYKETLTCPSCKVKRKDAVLTKCFHCFCYDCLRTRYETRQRKCPKCNAAFGASDYHRLYLS